MAHHSKPYQNFRSKIDQPNDRSLNQARMGVVVVAKFFSQTPFQEIHHCLPLSLSLSLSLSLPLSLPHTLSLPPSNSTHHCVQLVGYKVRRGKHGLYHELVFVLVRGVRIKRLQHYYQEKIESKSEDLHLHTQCMVIMHISSLYCSVLTYLCIKLINTYRTMCDRTGRSLFKLTSLTNLDLSP